ncbi:MAG: toprim domain-containing protein [Bacteroidales bacterium]|nr:toprim domain-containing protein [Bacteroidales bacterium]
MALEHCNFTTALQTISGNKFTPVEQSESNDIKREFEQKEYQFYPLQNHILLEYCASRGVSAYVAQKYCRECLKDHKYYYVAFPADKGGHVLRNGTKGNFAKINESGKPLSISTINNQSDRIVILEGFFDFLSLAEYWRYKTGKDIPYNAIVLNSCTMLSKAVIEQLSAYQKIYTLLDYDDAGIATTNKITSVYADKCENLTNKFLKGKYNDFNDYWIDYKKQLQKSL